MTGSDEGPIEVLAARVLLRPVDFETTLGFYERTLGLARFREFGAPPRRGVVLFLGGAYLELLETPPEGNPGPRPAGVRLWLQVRDVKTAYDAVTGRGAPGLEQPSRKPWGLDEATVADPDGTPVVLVEVPADHPLRRDVRGD